MAILVVGSFTVPVKGPDGAQQVDDEIGGDRTRMFTGQMRQTVRAVKQSWQVTTRYLTASDRTTLFTQLRSTPPVACSGDLLGGSVNCFAKVTAEQKVWKKGEIRYVISFTLWEQ